MYNHILVPVDDNPHSDNAISYAVQLAENHNAKLYFLHTIPTDSVEMATAKAEQLVTEKASQISDSIDSETVVTSGTPHREIVRVSDEKNIDLIVIGTHSRTGLKRLLIGSVNESTIRHTDVPVLTVQ
jgi:nucleotide-binding universal stress UspA family protein